MQKANGAVERRYIGMEREDYLQAIHELEKADGEARISALADMLAVKKPSVSQMVNRLEKQGYLKHEPYGGLRLTGKGAAAAKAVIERREALTEFFTTLGIAKKIQEKDVHGLEHCLSPITLKKLRTATKLLQDIKK